MLYIIYKGNCWYDTIVKLTDADKELLTLYFIEQFNFAEIAKKLSIGKSTVGDRLKLLKKRFRDLE